MSTALLLAALVLAPIIGGGFGELTNGILQLLVFAAVILHIYMRRDDRTWARVPGLAPLAVFMLLMLVSTCFSESIYLSLKQVLLISACLGAYMLSASLCRDAKAAAVLVWGLVLSALGICIFAVRNYAISTGGGPAFWKALLGSGEHARLFGPFVNPNLFAGFLVIALPLTLGVYLVTRRSVLAMLMGTAFVVEALALMLTGGKFGTIAAVAGLFTFFVLVIGTKALRRSRFGRLVVLALFILPLLALFSGPVRSRLAAAEEGGTQVHSTQFRIYTWKSTADMITHNPWVGVGPGAFEAAYPRYTTAGPTKHAHQSYLQIAAENGPAALIAFLALLGAVAYRSLAGIVRSPGENSERSRKAGEETAASGLTWKDLVPFSAWRVMNCAIFAALVGSAARNMVDSDWYVMGISLPFWTLAGMLVARSGAVGEPTTIKRSARAWLAGACASLMALGVSFALGDWYAPDQMQPGVSYADVLRRYEIAKTVSPLNPRYFREAGKYAAVVRGDGAEAMRNLRRAIRLAPTDGVNYHAAGMVNGMMGRPKAAINAFRQALRFNPNSTQTLYQLAQACEAVGITTGMESAYRRLLAIEKSPYEQVKGIPELVDTTFARAHAYFGYKYLKTRQYKPAVEQLVSAVDRLNRWRSNEQMLAVSRATGQLSREEERDLLQMLQTCYLRLADAYAAMGDNALAKEARQEAGKIEG